MLKVQDVQESWKLSLLKTSDSVDNDYVCVVRDVCRNQQVTRLFLPSERLPAAESIAERPQTQTNWFSSAVTCWYSGILGPRSALPCTLSAPGSRGLWPFTPFFLIAEIEFDRLHSFHLRSCQHVLFYPCLWGRLRKNTNMANNLRGRLKDVSKSKSKEGRRLF